MSTTLKWLDGSVVTALSSGLNSLANSTSRTTGLAGSTAIDNDAPLAYYADIEVSIAGFASSINQDVKVCDVYLLPTLDGSAWPDGHDAATRPNARYLVGSVVKATANGTGAVVEILSGIPLPPRDYKIVLCNTSGQAFTSSGHTVRVRPYNSQSV